MPLRERNIALAIGIGDAPPLPYLGGAINGAQAFHNWASTLGYESTVLTDKEQPVTIDVLRATLEAVLAIRRDKPKAIHRFALYFAGHGVIREAEEGLWLLSDWNNELRAVAVEGLKRRLYMHDIQQIAIFADSCRSLPKEIHVMDLTPDSVLGRGPHIATTPPAIDKFIAAQDGASTFMVPGTTPDDDRCLFSGLLLEGLWGTKPEAFSKVMANVITSRSLGAYLQAAVPKLAKQYERELVPAVSPNFPEGDDVYYGDFDDRVPPSPPVFAGWPPLATVALRGSAGRPAPGTIQSPVSDVAAPSLLDKMRAQPRPHAFETGAGFAFEGASICACWTPPNVIAERHGDNNWWRLRHKSDGRLLTSTPVLIECEDGQFAVTTALPGFIATVLSDQRGTSALIYRRTYSGPDTGALAESAISRMENGGLRSDDVANLAIQLRNMKHEDPVLGVISAYLYDAIGDTENIQRMAYYYIQAGQTIPFDIALLAQIRGHVNNGVLVAQVPAVAKRKPRTKDEANNQWTYDNTPEAMGEVGGFWPLMRQGWIFLDDPIDNESTLITPGLPPLAQYLLPSRFATMKSEGGRVLGSLFGLERHS